jgi:hypothetical protein
MPPWEPAKDDDVLAAVRAETSYENTSDELPDTQLSEILERAKHRVALETGSTSWYSDSGLGLVLIAYTCMRAKSAVENIPLSSYSIGDEAISFNTDDPEDSQQLQQWADDVRVGLDASSLDTKQGVGMKNTADYIGEDYVR